MIYHHFHHHFDWGIFWNALTAIIAIIGVCIAWYELHKNSKIAQADFIKRFTESFFTDETRTLFTLLMNSALIFEDKEIKNEGGEKIDSLPYFKIGQNIARQLRGIVKMDDWRTGYSAFEIDDFLLGYFDDIELYRQQKLIDQQTIEQVFGYYIVEVYKNEQIKSYINHPDNTGKYKDFRSLAKILGVQEENL